MSKHREFWKPLVGFGIALAAATFAGVASQVGPAAAVTALGAAVCFCAAFLLYR
jgi:hypothetical protein